MFASKTPTISKLPFNPIDMKTTVSTQRKWAVKGGILVKSIGKHISYANSQLENLPLHCSKKWLKLGSPGISVIITV